MCLATWTKRTRHRALHRQINRTSRPGRQQIQAKVMNDSQEEVRSTDFPHFHTKHG